MEIVRMDANCQALGAVDDTFFSLFSLFTFPEHAEAFGMNLNQKVTNK